MEIKENKLVHADSRLVIQKKALGEGEFIAILSTDDLDRHGEHVSIKGLEIDKNINYKMYYNHETTGDKLPIGKWLKIWKLNGKLMGHGLVDLNDPFAVMVKSKIDGGFIDSISIGFRATEYDGESSTWTKSTLVEASVVAEPANVAAKITSKELGFTAKEFKQQLIVKLAGINDVFVGEPGTPTDEAVQNAPIDKPEVKTLDDTEKPDSEDGAVDTEIKAAFEDLKSRIGAVEEAMKASADVPAIKTLIKLRGDAKLVDKAADELNKVLRIKLKGQSNV